jgi:putative DNA-invertase from lambdoid prophage Rac
VAPRPRRNDCTGNGISQLITTILGAVVEFERGLNSEGIKDAKRNLRRANKHQGGARPFGYKFGRASGHERPCADPRGERAAGDR